MYREWSRLLPETVEVLPAQLPGRAERVREAPIGDLRELGRRIATALVPHTRLPVALFGHSMGAWLALEVASCLEAIGKAPICLVVSGRQAPSVGGTAPPLHHLDDETFVRELQARYNAIPQEVLKHAELMELLLPALRADLEAIETYVHEPGPKVTCPVLAAVGSSDPVVGAEQLAPWADETTGLFEMTTFPGEHFYFRDDPLPLISRLRETLERASRRPLASRSRARNMPKHSPIAIIGIGCRFPGGVDSPRAFWEALSNGVDAVGPLPEARVGLADGRPPEGAFPGRGGLLGGFLEDVDRFDAAFFGLSPREVERMDPQHRLLLEVTWEALEDAALPVGALAGSRTGVFVGLWIQDYESRLYRDPGSVDFHMTTGTGRYAASGRISHLLGLQGPALTIDTACSSSLVAVHQACQSLWAGDSSLALAGGANVILQPQITIAYSRSGMIAADGRCKFGDSRADGYVRSEGAGIVVLKPLERAIADGDPVYAVILGGAVNNDGRSGEHFVTPAQGGQEEMLRLAWADAGADPLRAAYVEAHGTGTAAGDPVELGALGAVVGHGRPSGRPCLVGSVKTNFGHTEGAAGVAGLIKVALSLHHGAVPPSLNVVEPNPNIPWVDLAVRIATRMEPLDGDNPLAGVSSFGIAGTNAHVVLAPAPSVETPRGTSGGRSRLFPLSAPSEEGLRAFAARTADWLDGKEGPALSDVAYTLSARRTSHDQRLAVVAGSREEIVGRLREFADGGAVPEGGSIGSAPEGTGPTVVFVFPGQGAQWTGMGRELLAKEPVFREKMEACEAAMRPFVDFSVFQQLALDEDAAGYRLDEIDVIQPTLVALYVSLAALWGSRGLHPDAVVGHSMGEVAAAHVAGALSLEDAMRIICVRSKLLRSISGKGAMAVVELTAGEAREAIEPWSDRVAIAAANSPRSTVLSGEPDALGQIVEQLEKREVFCRFVAVDVASHSPQVDVLTGDLLAALDGLSPTGGSVAFHSTVTGGPLDGSALGPSYWVDNLRQPVMLTTVVEHLCGDAGARGEQAIFLELSPHPVLSPSIEQTVRATGVPGAVLGALRRGESEVECMLRASGGLWCHGAEPELVGHDEGARAVRLPPYPWRKKSFWLEVDDVLPTSGGAGHALLGRAAEGAGGVRVWEGSISLDRAPFLADHRVRGHVVLPAAAIVEMAFAAAAGRGEVSLEDVSFDEMVELSGGAALRIRAAVSPLAPGLATIELHAREGSDGGGWRPFASARALSTGEEGDPRDPPAEADREGPDPTRRRSRRCFALRASGASRLVVRARLPGSPIRRAHRRR